MPKFITSSTLWYSGIFAAATTLDASFKIERREQWDKAIEGVKEDLGHARTPAQEVADGQWDAEEAAKGPDVRYITLSFDEQDPFRYVDPSLSPPRWPANTGTALETHRLAPLSVYTPFHRKYKAETRQWSFKKLATIQTSIEIFQLRLMQRLQERGMSEDAANAVPDDYGKRILQNVETLVHQHSLKVEKLLNIKQAHPTLSDYEPPEDDVSLCNYTQDGVGNFYRIAEDLNSSLRQLFNMRSHEQISKPALFAKILYNLSISSAPPSLNTYNTLLTGLFRIDEPKLVRHVIASMCETHMRMNEVSLSTIMNFYTKENDRASFVRLNEKIRAKHGGLALARPDIENIRKDGRSRLMRKPDEPQKIILLPHPTPMVFGAVIDGVLKFAGFDTALAICEGMGREGWGLCMAGLTPLLQNCAERGDWTSGLAVWKQVQALKVKSRVKEGSKFLSERIGLDTFAAMLRLCSSCQQQKAFDSVWSQAMTAHRHSTERLVQLVKSQGGINMDGGTQPEAEATSAIDYGAVPENLDNVPPRDEVQTNGECSSNSRDDTSGLERTHQAREIPKAIAVQTTHAEIKHAPLEVPIHRTGMDQDLPRDGRRTDTGLHESHDLTRQETPPRTSSPVYRPFRPLEEAQLVGSLPSYDLDDYELRERPMSI